MLAIRKIISSFLILAMGVWAIPTVVSAQAQRSGLVPCGPEGGASGSGPGANVSNCTIQDLFGLLVNIYNYLLGLAGLVAFGFLIYGGIQMFFYSVDEEKLASGKKTVIEALIGIAIVLLAYIIVNTLLVALGVSDPQQYFNGGLFGGAGN